MKKVTKKQLNRVWRDPEWAFHHETTSWYYIDEDETIQVNCTQNARIEFSERTGIGYDRAIPGEYFVKAHINGQENVTYKTLIHDVKSHADLKRRATEWLYDVLNAA